MNWDAMIGLALLIVGVGSAVFLIWRDVRAGEHDRGQQ